MTAPMPETMSPREKVERAIIDVMKPHDADVTLGRVDLTADAILAALASSGDHAELVEDATEALQIIDAFPSNQGEVEGRITEKGDRLLASCTRDARLALEALLAENAALRAENTEAERKLAEAVGIASKLSTAISWLDYPFIDNNTSEDELRLRVGFMMKDAEQPRAMLSKEAERG